MGPNALHLSPLVLKHTHLRCYPPLPPSPCPDATELDDKLRLCLQDLDFEELDKSLAEAGGGGGGAATAAASGEGRWGDDDGGRLGRQDPRQ